MSTKITRRSFLRIALAAGGSAALAACSPATPAATEPPAATEAPEATEPPAQATDIPPTPVPATEAPPPSMYTESPMLAERVAAGDLPPIEERLPLEPKIVNAMPPDWLDPEVGKHGGTMRLAGQAVQYDNDGYMMHCTPLLNTPGIQGDNITPNILKSMDVNEDNSEFTFTLREGLKWSDGVPLTTEDLRFTWEDCILNEEYSPSGPGSQYRTGSRIENNPMTVEIIDDYTFKCTFDGVYGGFPVALAIQSWRSYNELFQPKHFMQQFHPDYADPDELQAMIEENNFETWVQLFNFKGFNSWDYFRERVLDVPKLTPWILVEASDERCVTERNPYYWKVDTAGNQLPYIDRIEYTHVPDSEVLSVKQFAGEVDYGCETVGMPKLALFRENEDQGNYFLKVGNIHRTSGVAFLNLTYPDEAWRKVVQNVDFRRALSVAIDRVELIDAVYYGLGEPSHLNPNEYDPDLANELLDSIGMDQRDADGWRLDPDGNPFVIEFDVWGTVFYDNLPTAELYTQYWKDVGINTTLQSIDDSLYGQRRAANESKATTIFDVSTLWFYQAYGWAYWDVLWNTWWGTQGEQGEEPPDDYKALRAKVQTIMEVTPDVGRWEVTPEVEQMIYDNVYYFVPTVNQKQPRIESKDFGNVSDNEMAFSIVQTLSMEQVYYKSI
jgi:peptide/nickel transport system substrate-binding protein